MSDQILTDDLSSDEDLRLFNEYPEVLPLNNVAPEPENVEADHSSDETVSVNPSEDLSCHDVIDDELSSNEDMCQLSPETEFPEPAFNGAIELDFLTTQPEYAEADRFGIVIIDNSEDESVCSAIDSLFENEWSSQFLWTIHLIVSTTFNDSFTSDTY